MKDALLAALSIGVACHPPPNAVLTIEDPQGLAGGAVAVKLGSDLAQAVRVPLDGRSFPVSVALTNDEAGAERLIWVDAVDGTDRPLARGNARVRFRPKRKGHTAVVQLAAPCGPPGADGLACALPDGSGHMGICLRGQCGVSTCGDGYTDAAAGEECDEADNSDNGACLPECVRAACGDGKLWQEVEVCDDGNTSDGDGPCLGDCSKREECGDAVIDPLEECDDGPLDNPNDGCDRCLLTSWTARILVGQGPGGGDPLAEKMVPVAVTADQAGNWYVGDSADARVIELAQDGANRSTFTILGGSRVQGGQRTVGLGSMVNPGRPSDLAVDGLGNIYIASGAYHCVVMLDAASGAATVLAGIPNRPGNDGDGGPADAALLDTPLAVAVDGVGNVFIADHGNLSIRRLAKYDGTIATLSLPVMLKGPVGVAVGASGQLYVLDREIAGGLATLTLYQGATSLWSATHNVAAAAERLPPFDFGIGMAPTDRGLFVADPLGSELVRCQETTCAPVTLPLLDTPVDLALDLPSGRLLVADFGARRVWSVDPDNPADTQRVAGQPGWRLAAEGLLATTVRLASVPTSALEGLGIDTTSDALYLVQRADNALVKVVPASSARSFVELAADGLCNPVDVAVDGSSIYVSDAPADCLAGEPPGRIQRIDGAGTVSTLFASPSQRVSALALGGATLYAAVGSDVCQLRTIEAAPLCESPVSFPGAIGDVAATADGAVVYVTGFNRQVVAKWDGSLSIIAGSLDTPCLPASDPGCGDEGPATAAKLNGPAGLALDELRGRLYVADVGGLRVRFVDLLQGTIHPFAGTGVDGLAGDGGPAADAPLGRPTGLLLRSDGSLLISTEDGSLHVVRQVDPGGAISTLVGPIEAVGNGPLAEARLGAPTSIVVRDPATWLIADAGAEQIREVDGRGGWLSSVAGYPRGAAPAGAPAVARYAGLAYPWGLVLEAGRFVYVSEAGAHAIDRLDLAEQTISRYAGGSPGHADGPSTSAQLGRPCGLAIDPTLRVIYVADAENHAVRAICLDSAAVWTVAGTPRARGASETTLNGPTAVAIDPTGNGLYVADTGNHRVQWTSLADWSCGQSRLSPPPMTTVLGDGTAASSGEGAPASAFPVDSPQGLAVDLHGNLFVGSRTAVRVVTAGADGFASADDRVITIYGTPPRDGVPESVTASLTGLVVLDAEADSGDADRALVLDAWIGVVVQLDRVP